MIEFLFKIVKLEIKIMKESEEDSLDIKIMQENEDNSVRFSQIKM
jgi:hypothetical protein